MRFKCIQAAALVHAVLFSGEHVSRMAATYAWATDNVILRCIMHEAGHKCELVAGQSCTVILRGITTLQSTGRAAVQTVVTDREQANPISGQMAVSG